MRINILDLYNHEKNSMKIYPNPTGGLVKIKFVEPFSQGKISVYEMTGKLVQEFNIENQKQFQFILEGETGVYIIEHQTALGIVNRQRITKLDRKSTRLNSSHVRISYAVFCLKKKMH